MVSYDTPGGARFIKADLHVHTPDSYDYEDDAVPGDLVAAFEEEGLELIAVTDHNTTGFYESLAEAAEESSVTILPGVEITTGQSGEHQIHMTAIFPPENSDEIDNFLYEIGISGDPQDVIADQTIPSICEEVRSFGGLPILAHIDENAGAHHELSERNNPTRQRIFDEDLVAALEIVSRETKAEYPDFTHIRSSDAHSISQIGRRYTHLKMNEPSFEGLRTALTDPNSRVSIDEHLNDHVSIDGLLVNDGFLQDRHLKFNKNLNCLIGGKGAGKSSVIEHIRYVLDIEPRSDPIAEEYHDLIDSTLEDDGVIKVVLTGSNGDQYRISRRVNEEPEIRRITEDGSDVTDPIDIPIEQFRNEFFDAEIHSQRELLGLARDQTDQLNLLDSYFNIEEELEVRDSTKDRIREKSREIDGLKENVADLTDKKHRFDTLSQQVEMMKEKGVVEYVEGQEEWERERATLSNAVEGVEELESTIDSLDLAETIDDIEMVSGPNTDLLSTAEEKIRELKQHVSEQEEELLETVSETRSEVEGIRSKWNEANEEREQEHSTLAEEIKDEIGVDINEFFEKQTAMQSLSGTEEELREKETELESARGDKRSLFEQLDEARQDLTEARQEGISDLNGALNDVRVSLRGQSNRSEYVRWINHVLEGSRVHTQDKERISAIFDPPELAEIVRTNDADRLIEDAEVSPTAAENFLSHDDLNERLEELELLEVRDRPIIELNDNGWKELSDMSDGQQCTALLSITMVQRDVPLIIDQPEDMLDNKFIFSEVVQLVRSIKHDRQIIAATHNANIPVLGDAEQIIVMRSNANTGFYGECGAIDDEAVKELTQDILEGGEQAFMRRNEKYRGSV